MFVEMFDQIRFKLVPTSFIAVIAIIEINAAIKAYSIIVTPFWYTPTNFFAEHLDKPLCFIIVSIIASNISNIKNKATVIFCTIPKNFNQFSVPRPHVLKEHGDVLKLSHLHLQGEYPKNACPIH